ncbi:MAG: alpha/beta fold hydrolase [Cyanobacteria bacterium P01_G01_bin.19]
MSIKEDKIQAGEFRWFYRQTEIASERTPILFLHGLPSHSYTWQKMMLLLEEENIPSTALDWLGCGFSDKPKPKDFAYTPAAFLAELERAIAALELEQFYLVVQGFLGSVGVQYALKNPDRVEGLIMLNAPLTSGVKLPWLMKQLSLPLVGDMMTQDPLLVDRTIEKGSGFVITDEDLETLRKPFLQSSAVGRSLMTILKKLDLDRTTAEIQAGLETWSKPSLIIWGSKDPWLKLDDLKKLTQTNSEIDLLELDEAKHYPQEHWASDISQAIIQFFRRKVF